MLRRFSKRIAAENPAQGKPIKRQRKKRGALGDKKDKLKDEKVLEDLVFGSGEAVLDNIQKQIEKSKEKKRKVNVEAKPVWQDEDDNEDEGIVTSKKKTELKSTVTEESTSETVKPRVSRKQQFEKISGTPDWAKLKWQKAEEDKNVDSDEDQVEEEFLKQTGDYLAKSDFLPKTSVQLKRCTDANHSQPSKSRVKSVEFHPSAQVILTAGMDNTLGLFQVDGKQNAKIQSIFLDKFPISTAHFTRNGQEVILGSQRRKSFYHYDMIAGKVHQVPHIKGVEENSFGKFEMSPDGKYIVFLGLYGHMHLVSSESKEWITSFKMNGSVESVSFTPDGGTMYSIGSDGEVYVWDMSTRDCVHRFIDDGCLQGNCVKVSPNGRYLATGSYSGVVNIYERTSINSNRSPRPLKAVMNLTTPCTSMVFNSTTEFLAIASNYTEHAVKLLHFPSLSVFANFPAKEDRIRIPLCMDVSLNSGYFAVGNHCGNALLYRVKHYGNY